MAVALSPKAFDTLVLLLRHRHRVLPKDELFREVWGDVSVSEDSLTQTISSLRRALGDDRSHAEYIATVPRRGYRFVAPVINGESERLSEAATVGTSAAVETVRAVRTSELHDAAGRRRWAWAVAFAAVVAAAVAVAFVGRRPSTARQTPPDLQPIYFPLEIPRELTTMSGGLLSPTGDRVAFVAFDNDTATVRIWLRHLSAPDVRPLSGTEDAERPFWSPDGQQIAFFAHSQLKVINIASHSVEILASIDGGSASGGAWSPDGTILYGGFRTGLTAINATGGERRQVTEIDPEKNEGAHRRPQFLPGGKRFLYYVQSVDTEQAGTYIGSLEHAEAVKIAPTRAVYTDPGYLLYVQDHTLLAQRFDAASGQTAGGPAEIYGDVTPNAEIYASPHAVTFGSTGGGLVWMNRAGETLGSLNAPTELQSPVLSPDGRYVAASSVGAELRGLWLIDLSSGSVTRAINDAHLPIWSPDGTELAYYRENDALGDVYRSPANQTEMSHLMLRTRRPKLLTDWSPRGLVFSESSPGSKYDIWMLSGDNAKPVPLVQSPFNEMQGQWSPDERWLAFASDESGSWGIYVQSADTPAIRRAVSPGGGAAPRWRADGRELFYIAPNRMLMSVQVTPGTTWQASRPEALFRVPIARQLTSRPAFFAVTTDGERFLIVADGNRKAIPVIVNWQSLIANPKI